MRQSKIVFRVIVIGFFLGAFVCATASALAAPSLSSTAHLGFAVADQSSTGFEKVSGSVAFLDVTYGVTPRLQLGMRSLAQGGRRDGEFYRMGAGPLVNVALTTDWSAQVAYGFFKETGLDADGETAYKSRGRNLMVGWEQRNSLTPRLDLLWGGFFCQHSGDVETAAAVSPAGQTRFAAATTNKGLTHGLEIALRMSL
jgi:hypothetical protein